MNLKLNPIVKKRIKTFFIFLPLPIIAIILVFLTLNKTILSGLSHRQLYHLTGNIGFYGVFIFAIPIALFAFRLLMKYSTPKGVKQLEEWNITLPAILKENLEPLKNIFMWLAKLMQKLHIPISLLATSVIGYHVYLAFHMGWVWSIGYILGLIAAIFLLIITITGIARIFNKSIKTHKFLMFGFVIFTVLHVIFI